MILVIGYGDILRGDDGVGQKVVAQLSYRLKLDGVEFIACHQLTPELADPISKSQHVVFIDASMGGTAGEVEIHSINPLPTAAAFTHHVSLPSLLALARNWYGHSPCGTLLTVCGENFGYSKDLSPAVRAALPRLVAQLCWGITTVQGMERERLR